MKASPDEDYASIPGEEPRGKGLNENVYWVTHDLLGEWQKLPDARAKDIVAARLIKKILTGDLDAPVNAYPFFTGRESALLRAQIARITAATVLAPTGVFKVSDENRKGWTQWDSQIDPIRGGGCDAQLRRAEGS